MRRALARTIVAFVLSAVATAALAQVQLVFPSAAERVAWVDLPSAAAAPDSAQRSSEVKIALSTGALGAESSVFVVESASGNLAIRPVTQIQKEGGTWKVSPNDFVRAHHVQFKLTHQGKPVAAAQVSVKHKLGLAEALVTPSDQGIANLYGIGLGPMQVTVKTKSEGKEPDIPTMTFELEKSRYQPVPLFEVAIAPKVDVVTSESTSPSGETGTDSPGEERATGGSAERPVAQRTEPAPDRGNPFGQFLTLLVGLALGGALIYYLPKLVQKNHAQIDGALAKVGVQIPKDPDPAADDPLPATPQPSKPAPQAQILLDQGQPTPNPAEPQAAVVAFTGSPGLVSLTGGARLEIPEGRHVVTREPGAPLSLAGEASVSRSHAELYRDGSSLTVEDLGSTNGTYVNGQKVTGVTPLKAGDNVQFGTSTWRVEAR